MVRSHCPISGAPIFMVLASIAEHEARKERRMREDAERVALESRTRFPWVSREFIKAMSTGGKAKG